MQQQIRGRHDGGRAAETRKQLSGLGAAGQRELISPSQALLGSGPPAGRRRDGRSSRASSASSAKKQASATSISTMPAAPCRKPCPASSPKW